MTSEVTMEAAEVEGTLTLHQALSGSNGDSIFYPILYYVFYVQVRSHSATVHVWEVRGWPQGLVLTLYDKGNLSIFASHSLLHMPG